MSSVVRPLEGRRKEVTPCAGLSECQRKSSEALLFVSLERWRAPSVVVFVAVHENRCPMRKPQDGIGPFGHGGQRRSPVSVFHGHGRRNTSPDFPGCVAAPEDFEGRPLDFPFWPRTDQSSPSFLSETRAGVAFASSCSRQKHVWPYEIPAGWRRRTPRGEGRKCLTRSDQSPVLQSAPCGLVWMRPWRRHAGFK